MSTVSEQQKKASEKYVKNNYDEIKVRVPKGKKEMIQNLATQQNESTNAFINRAVNEAMERDKNKKD